MTKLDEIRARLAAATPGPWVADDEDCYVFGAAVSMTRGWGAEVSGHTLLEPSRADATSFVRALQRGVHRAQEDGRASLRLGKLETTTASRLRDGVLR